MERTGVASLPTKALRFTPTSETIGPKDKIVDCKGTNKVWVKDGRTFKAYAVQTGITNGTRTEIISELPADAQVIVEMKDAGSASESEDAATERSPFAPGPPDQNKNKKK